MSLILRNVKGTPLTYTEMDDNLIYLEQLSTNDLASVLAQDNETDGNDIVLTTGDKIVSSTGNSEIELDDDTLKVTGDLDLNGNFNAIDITHADLITLRDNGNLQTGRTYHITDSTQGDIWINSLTNDTLSTEVYKLFYLIPNDYYNGTTGEGVFFNGNNVINGQIWVYGGRLWECILDGTGIIAFGTTQLPALNFNMIPTTDPVYDKYIFKSIYDIDADWVRYTRDFKGNIIESRPSDVGPIDLTDFGDLLIRNNRCRYIVNNKAGDITNNIIGGYILNNNLTGVLVPRSIFDNKILGNISDNNCEVINRNSNFGNINNNSINGFINSNRNGGNINNNSNNGDIVRNSNSGNGGNINNNSNNGFITRNSNDGSITGNSNDGSITRNRNGGNINSNSNDGIINDNSNIGNISGNSNIGSIYSNSNTGGINNNSNDGIIVGNSNIGPISVNSNDGVILNNNNSGVINSNSNSGNINSNSNIGNINNNSNDGVILNNNNSGDIINNANNGVIEYNSNSGNIFNNTSDVGTTFGIRNNRNNDFIGYNNSTANINIIYNVNNGYIGDLSVAVNRAATITDTITNK